MTPDEVKHLANLARIELTEQEIESFRTQFSDILGFVDQIKEADVTGIQMRDFSHINVFRDDVNPHEAGENRDLILAGMPEVRDNLLKVKRILPK